MTADKTAGKQRGRPFQHGRSGNPKGRPKGRRNRATLLAQKLLDDDAEAIMRKVIDEAKGGNMKAAQLCVERLVPPRRERVVTFPMPQITRAGDAPAAFSAITSAVASGALSVSEAAEIGKIVEGFVRAVEATDLATRLAEVEKRLAGGAVKRVA